MHDEDDGHTVVDADGVTKPADDTPATVGGPSSALHGARPKRGGGLGPIVMRYSPTENKGARVRTGSDVTGIKLGWKVVLAVVAVASTAIPFMPTPAFAHSPSVVFTVAGTGTEEFCCDGGPATLADLDQPRGLAVMPDGGFLIAEAFSHIIRRVFPNGTAQTVAGNGYQAFSGDGGQATSAALNLPHAMVVLAGGGFLIDDAGNFRIRRVGPDGVIQTVAGNGTNGFSGDGGPASAATISAPRGIAGTADGGYLIADTDNNRVRKVASNGIITTVAGTGAIGASGDGGPATAAALNRPYGVTGLPDGSFLIADTSNNRIRKVSSTGVITAFAGTGSAAFAGDGGSATSATLNFPVNTGVLPDGTVVIADALNDRVRQVSPQGVISTLAGNGTSGFSGDGVAPNATAFFTPKAAVPFAGGVLIADSDNQRVRLVGSGPWPAPPLGSGVILINANAAKTATPTVTITSVAHNVNHIRLSNSPATTNGVLSKGRTQAAVGPISWDLTDASTGGSTAQGRRLVYAQWQGHDGQWSAVQADSIIWGP